MNIHELEIERQKLNSTIKVEKSPRILLFELNNYLEKIVSVKYKNIYESFFIEFLSKYIELIDSFSPVGIDPAITEQILKNAKSLLSVNAFSEFLGDLSKAINALENKYLLLHKVLEGEKLERIDKGNIGIPFPVIEQHPFNNNNYGLIEHLQIIIRKGKNPTEDQFTIIPSQVNLEKKLTSQIEKSWQLSKNYCKDHIRKIYPSHEVIIRFSEKYGNYVGESLGVALTIGFIEELHKFYNLPIDVSVNKYAVFTGGIDEDGNVKSVSSKVINKKIETVFYSCKNIFAIPKGDETSAGELRDNLKKTYPKRNLKLVPVEDISDLINRRDLLDIRKQNPIKRTAKFMKKKAVTVSLAIILLGIFSFNLLKYFNNKPVKLVDNDKELIVENKYGKTLFIEKVYYQLLTPEQKGEAKYYRRLIDIDNDGTNELLLLKENLDNPSQNKSLGRLACFNNKGKLIWSNIFSAQIKTKRDSFSSTYKFERILGITKRNGRKIIYASAREYLYYPTAVVSLDAKSGKRVGKIFWHPGSINFGMIGDFNKDQIPRIILFGINNGMERCAVMSINLDELNGRAPSKPNYCFLGYPVAKFNKYILLPKTDYNDYFKIRYNKPAGFEFEYNFNKLYIYTNENGKIERPIGVGYYLDKNLSNPEVIIGDDFQIARDSLVVHGKLHPPLTNTNEYRNILLNQFMEWDAKSGKFVKIIKK